MYEVGRVYIWQNLNYLAEYNGQETTVLEAIPQFRTGSTHTAIGWKTDTVITSGLMKGGTLYAEPGQLRPKEPPRSGEVEVMKMFVNTPVRVEESA